MRLLLSLLIMTMMSGICHASEITIGLIPEQNVFKQMKRYKPLGGYIEKKTGIVLNFTVLPRYGNILESFSRRKLDGAFWGSFTGAMAIQKLGVQPIARPVNLDGTSSYSGYIFVHKESGIDNVEGMRNSVIAFVDKATTAGYVFPMAYFQEQGVAEVDRFFKESYFTGSHDAAIYAVLQKDATVGCAKNTIFDMLARTESAVKEDLVVLVKSPEVPSNGLGLRRDIAPEIQQKIKGALLGMHRDPEGRTILKRFGAIQFIETMEDDYTPVFELARKAGIDLKRYDYTND